MSRMKELEEQKVELVKEIRELADRQDKWEGEDEKRWIEVNELYDKNAAEAGEIRRNMEVATRLAELDEQNDREQHSRNTGLGELRYAKRTAPTIEDRSLAMQAWFWEGRGRDLTKEQQLACRLLNFNPGQRELVISPPQLNAHRGYQMFECKTGPDQRTMRELFDRHRREYRVSDTTSGAGTIPEGFVYELEEFMLAYGGVRRVARVFQTNSEGALRFPTADDTANAAAIVAESGDVTATDADPTFSEVTLGSYKYASTVTVSAELIDDSAFNMPSLLAEFLGTRIGRGQAAHFTNGTGTAQPEGIVTGSNKGADAAVSALTGDNLIDLQGALDPAYESLPSIGFMFNKATLTAIRKLKVATDNEYLWQPGLRAAEPDLLLGKPYVIVQEMPDIGVSTKSVLYGAFEKYLIRDVSPMRFYRLQELNRMTDQDTFVIFRRSDGKILNPNAILHLLHAAS